MSSQALICHDLVKFFGDRCVLDGVSLVASPGQRIGLVGENGAGKSTLLRLLAGVDLPDAGTIEGPADIGLLHQELPFAPEQTVAEVLADALAESRELLRRLDELLLQPSNLDEYAEILLRAEQADAWDAERRALEIVHGLGLKQIGEDRPLGTLSGGQRSRLALAALLIRRPAALLLDEPTNHLDDEALAFVERQLRELPGVVVVASHDRVFLDEVCTDIVDLDPSRGGVTRFGGAYTDYLAAKRAERARWEQAFAEEQDQMNSLRASIRTTARQVGFGRPRSDGDKMGYGRRAQRVEGSISSRVRNAKQRLEVLEREQVGKPPALLRFQAPPLTTVDVQDGRSLMVRGLEVPGRLRLDRLDLASDGRLLVTGANGSGKSTLLAVLSGALKPGRGTVQRNGLRLSLLAQDDVWPDLSLSPREIYGEQSIPLIELGLVRPQDLDRPIGTLSVGQRRRLALALVIAQPPDVLLLDEPTNHLSLTLAEELEEALGSAPGAVVVASHDRWLRRHWDGGEIRLSTFD